MQITKKDFGKNYQLITIENESGFHLSVTDLGARIVSLGRDKELILTFDSAEEYLEKDAFIGASIGRTAGRIENGRFTLDGKAYQVAIDPETGHSLHGGKPGFETKKWDYTIENGDQEASVIFTTTSPDGEHGFPGNLRVEVRHTLTNENVWRVTTKAVSDQTTLFNPTNHVYFNLTGDATQAIDEHKLWLNSDSVAVLRPDTIPTGEILNVTDTPFDFQTETTLTDLFASDFEQKNLCNGLDHPFFLKESDLNKPAATLTSPDGSVELIVSTDSSSVVIFTANFGEDGPMMQGKNSLTTAALPLKHKLLPEQNSFLNLARSPYLQTNHLKQLLTIK